MTRPLKPVIVRAIAEQSGESYDLTRTTLIAVRHALTDALGAGRDVCWVGFGRFAPTFDLSSVRFSSSVVFRRLVAAAAPLPPPRATAHGRGACRRTTHKTAAVAPPLPAVVRLPFLASLIALRTGCAKSRTYAVLRATPLVIASFLAQEGAVRWSCVGWFRVHRGAGRMLPHPMQPAKPRIRVGGLMIAFRPARRFTSECVLKGGNHVEL